MGMAKIKKYHLFYDGLKHERTNEYVKYVLNQLPHVVASANTRFMQLVDGMDNSLHY
jgi:hypothetical protein